MRTFKLFSVVVALFLSLSATVSAKYPVLSREAHNGGFFGYKDVVSTPTIFLVIVNGNESFRTGYAVCCDNPGWETCPKLGQEYVPAVDPPADWDAVQIDKTDYLVAYALDQIENHPWILKYAP